MKVVLLPPVPALLPEYASLADPVASLRTAIIEAVSDLRVTEIWASDGLARRVGAWAAKYGAQSGPDAILLLANGSARRSEKAPGHLDDRAQACDAAVERDLRAGDADALAATDQSLATDLLADLTQLQRLAGMGRAAEADLRYAADPYGVQYWVAILDW